MITLQILPRCRAVSVMEMVFPAACDILMIAGSLTLGLSLCFMRVRCWIHSGVLATRCRAAVNP